MATTSLGLSAAAAAEMARAARRNASVRFINFLWFQINAVKNRAVQPKRLELCGFAGYLHRDKVLGADDFPSDSGGRFIDVVQGGATAARGYVVNSILQIVLIVVVVAEEPGGQVLFLEQRHQRCHLRIIALPSRNRRHQ